MIFGLDVPPIDALEGQLARIPAFGLVKRAVEDVVVDLDALAAAGDGRQRALEAAGLRHVLDRFSLWRRAARDRGLRQVQFP